MKTEADTRNQHKSQGKVKTEAEQISKLTGRQLNENRDQDKKTT